MPAQIEQLIDKLDGSQIVRDRIAEILVVESARQQELAVAAAKDPTPWILRVFVGRANPWQEFQFSPPPGTVASTPIVNVSFKRVGFDMRFGNVVDQKRGDGLFYIDCYGLGVSADAGVGEGHLPGDELAQLEAHRAAVLVRNILDAGTYAYLGLRGLVARRWVDSIEINPEGLEPPSVQHVVAARISLKVDFNEFSPQVQGVPIAEVSVEVRRAENGQILLRAVYPSEDTP